MITIVIGKGEVCGLCRSADYKRTLDRWGRPLCEDRVACWARWDAANMPAADRCAIVRAALAPAKEGGAT